MRVLDPALALSLAAAFSLAVALLPQASATSGAATNTWADWDKLQICHPTYMKNDFTSEEDISKFLASTDYDQYKTVGAGHSFSAITLTDDSEGGRRSALLNLDNFSGIVAIDYNDDGSANVEVKAGTRLRDLNALLEEQSLSLVNLGATAAQSIAGAISTSTHGTGKKLGSLSASVVGIRLVDGQGRVWDSKQDPEVLLYGRVSLGVLGVISTVTVRAVPLFKMQLSVFTVPLDELLAQHDYYMDEYDRFQFSFVPYTNEATVVLREEVPLDTPIENGGCWATPPETVTYPCVDVSYKTLVDSLERYDNRTIYTEMEMFVPVEKGVAAIRDFMAFQDSVQDQHDDSACSLFTNIRYVAADDIPVSPMLNRDIAVLSFICLGDKDSTGSPVEFERYARGLENLTSEKYEGVPHWGKQNYATEEDLEKFYDFEGFKSFRKRLDEGGVFLNDYTRDRLGL
jgi:L-gulonolactone oxidase